jgi:hypothetical protein
MVEAVRFLGNRKLHAKVMLRAEVPHGHPRRGPCELRVGEIELGLSWLGWTDPLALAG